MGHLDCVLKGLVGKGWGGGDMALCVFYMFMLCFWRYWPCDLVHSPSKEP